MMFRLLVADDETDVCDFVKHFFEERDYEVITAADGEEAVKIAKNNKFDVILLDMKMPKMTGIEALKAIKEHDQAQKVIMVTAVSEQDNMNEAERLGVHKYILKPLVLEELESTVYSMTKDLKK